MFGKKLPIIGLLLWCLSTCLWAQEFEEGKHYKRISALMSEHPLVEEIQADPDSQVQVLEFFSYGCSWCFKLDEHIEKWAQEKSAEIDFERVPVVFQPSWRLLTKAYYTAEALGSLPKVHTAIFKAIHEKRETLDSPQHVEPFFTEHGISSEAFQTTFKSFSLNRQVRWANAISKAFHITSIPTLVILGPKEGYMTSVSMAGSEDNLIEVIQTLSQKILESQGA